MAYGKSRLTKPEVVRLELRPPTAEQEKLLRHTMSQLRRVANLCVRSWLLYHERHHTPLKMECYAAIHPCPPELCARWLREATALCPDVHCATVLAVTNWLAQTITSQKSPRTNEKRWRAVLRCDESHWQFSWPLPIRLWNGNAKLARFGGGLAALVRLDRILGDGPRATSTITEIHLVPPKTANRSAGHRLAYLAAAEIADGARKLAQSQITFDDRLRKWFLFLTVEAPSVDIVTRDPARLIVVRPGRRAALRIHADRIAGGIGKAALDRVATVRPALDARRQSWRKAHADCPLPHSLAADLTVAWRHKSSAICDLLVAEVVRSLRTRDFGRVLWLDGNNRQAGLAVAGKSCEGDRRELFPFEQLRKKATKRLGELGIEVVGRANFRSVKRRKAERRKRVAADTV